MAFKIDLKNRMGIPNKFIVGLVLVIMVGATGVSATPAVEDTMLNPVSPDGYKILGPDRLTFNDARSNSPNILIDADDNLHLIWSDSRNDPDPDDTSYIYEIFYKKFDKNGNVLVDDTRMNDATGIDIQPYRWYIPGTSAALDSDGDIHVAYIDYTKHKYASYNAINAEIYYMKFDGSLDCGGAPAERSDLVLIDEQRVSEGAAHSGSQDLTVDSDDNIHIVWYDHRSAWYNWEIYYEKLSNDGDVLVDDKRLTYYLDYCSGPEIAIDSENNLHVAFKSYDWADDMNSIYYLKLDADGNELVSPKLITSEGITSPTPYGKGYPLITLDSSDNIHMSWHDERDADNYEIYYLKLSSIGDPLMTEPLRITHNSGDSQIQAFAPVQSMAAGENDRMYLGWCDNTPGPYQVYLAVLNTDGTFHLEPYQVTVSDSLSESPSFAIDSNGYAHMAWMDTINYYPEIYHIVLQPTELDLAFVPTGVPGGSVDIGIYEDDVLIDELTVERFSGNPRNSAVMYTLEVALEKSYRLEFTYTATKNGANPMKVYQVEDGELTEQLLRTVVNENSGKSPKHTATLILDELISGYF